MLKRSKQHSSLTANYSPYQLLLAAVLSILPASSFSAELTLLYWGDRYGQNFPTPKSERDTTSVGGAAQLAGLIETFRKASPATLVLAAGGDLAGSVASIHTEGEAPARVLGRIRPDVYAPGVVDFTFGTEALLKALKKGKVNAVLANAYLEGEGPLLPFDASFNCEGVKVAVTAVVPSRLKESITRDLVTTLSLSEPGTVVKDFIHTQRGKADVLVLLSQLGWEFDSLLARAMPELDVIIEGNYGERFDPPRQIGKTIIASSGPRGVVFGRLVLKVDPDAGTVVLQDSDFISVEPGICDRSIPVERVVVEQELRYTRSKGDEIATLMTDWNVDPNAPSNLPQWVADAMLTVSDVARLSLVNNADLGKGVPRGDLHERDVEEIMPFNTPLLAFQINGRELRRAIEMQAAGATPFMTWGGLRVTLEGNRVKEITIPNAVQMTDNSDFAVLTSGLVWDRFLELTGINPYNKPIFIFPMTLRELIHQRASRQKVISTPLDARWLVE
jgi:2',3'-cyclic-nucleotide 2'-phosphodiesterase (5'-nucleotidase family)